MKCNVLHVMLFSCMYLVLACRYYLQHYWKGTEVTLWAILSFSLVWLGALPIISLFLLSWTAYVISYAGNLLGVFIMVIKALSWNTSQAWNFWLSDLSQLLMVHCSVFSGGSTFGLWAGGNEAIPTQNMTLKMFGSSPCLVIFLPLLAQSSEEDS